MPNLDIDQLALQLRIALLRVGAIPSLIALMLTFGAGACLWLAAEARVMEVQQSQSIAKTQREPRLLASGGAGVSVTQEFSTEQKLRDFYAVLGEPGDVELHLDALFNIAAKIGLELDQGEYKWEYDADSHVYRHQILLPVKGDYRMVRDFCEQILLAMPFASLDELGFKRESVGDDTTDGTLRFTLYLNDRPQVGKSGAAQP